MKYWMTALLAGGALVLSSCVTTAPPPGAQPIVYPETRTVDQVDTHFGVAVADPYRWLEQDVRTSPAVAQWVAAQNAVTRAYLDALPQRAPIAERLRALWSYDQYSVPVMRGERLFYTMQLDGQNQPALYVQDGPSGEPRLLLDPNSWSEDGASNIASFQPSPDGSRLAYSVQDSGSDWRIIRVLDVVSGETLADEIRWAKFTGIEWHPDGESFYYARYPEPPQGEMFTALNHNHAIYRHRLGTAQSEDRLVYARPQHPRDNVSAEVSDDDRWLVITVSRGTDARYEIVLLDLTIENAQPRVLIEGFENDYRLVGQTNDGRLVFLTDRGAARGRLVSIDPTSPAESNWRMLVAEGEDVLVGADRIGDEIIARYLTDARSSVRRYRLDGRAIEGELELPGLGSVLGFAGSPESPITYYIFSSFNRPATVYRFDTRDGETAVFRAPQVDFDPEDYVVEQVFYDSEDGVRVPMFIVHRRDVTPNGARPTLLYAYGGFNAAQLPSSSRNACNGWRWAAFSYLPTSAAAASTARNGTMPAGS